VGLRTLMNRLTSTVLPVILGVLVAWVGLEESFAVLGIFISVMMVCILYFGRAKKIL
jgi:hypothetical protein